MELSSSHSFKASQETPLNHQRISVDKMNDGIVYSCSERYSVLHYLEYSGTSLIQTPMGRKKVYIISVSEVSSFLMLKCMQEWYLGREKVSCLERCPQLKAPPYHCITVP